MKIGTLGPKGTFSHEAALKYDSKAEIVFKETIMGVFDSVKNDEVEIGIVPIENSASGTIGLVLDALMNHDVNIIDEVIIPVKHNLAGKGSIKDIKTIYAHPQAYEQCERFIRTSFSKVDIIETSSNGKSAEKISKKEIKKIEVK
jgi:prephenate dehydratase